MCIMNYLLYGWLCFSLSCSPLCFKTINSPGHILISFPAFPLACIMSFFKQCQDGSKQFQHSCDPTAASLTHSKEGEWNQYCI